MLPYSSLVVTAADALAYVTAREITGWPAAQPSQLAALQRGQDYVAREYNGRWLTPFTVQDVPELVKLAIYEAAINEARNPGVLSPVGSLSDARVLTQVGEIKWTPLASSEKSGSSLFKPTLTSVEALLSTMVKSSSGYGGMFVV